MVTTQRPRRKHFILRRVFAVSVVIAVILALLWVASELAIPPIATSVAKNRIKNKYPDATDVSVSIKGFPALKLVWKKYDSLTVKIGRLKLQGVNFDQLELKSDKWPKGTFKGVISQDEISRFFSLKNSYVINPELSLVENGIIVNGQIDIGVAKVTVNSTGRLESVDGKRIFFRPQNVEVMGIKVPSQGVELVRQVIDENPVFTVREDLPYAITKITPEQGKLVIEGTVDLEKALNVHL